MTSTPVLAALLTFVGILVVILTQHLRTRRKVKDLTALLESAYLEQPGSPDFEPAEVQRLLARTGTFAERTLGETGFMARLRSLVDRSDWTISAGELLVVSLVLGGLGVVAGWSIGSPPLIVLLGAAGLFGPYLGVRRSVDRRKRRFESQFPDVLDLMAASLESGAGISQALELVVAESDDPAADEFGRVLAATRLGSPLVDALRELADRIGSRDLTWTVQAMNVASRTGGRLADILRIVADFMRAREEVRRELQALTAEGKLSAYVLGGLPFAIAGFLLVINPDYLEPLYTTVPGILMLTVTGILMALAFVVMFRIIKVDI